MEPARALHCPDETHDRLVLGMPKNNLALYRTANMPDILKSEKVQKQEQHLYIVQQERSLYNNLVHESKLVAAANNISTLAKNDACSTNISMHYSFDFAQQVHFPSDPLQPGPNVFFGPEEMWHFWSLL